MTRPKRKARQAFANLQRHLRRTAGPEPRRSWDAPDDDGVWAFARNKRGLQRAKMWRRIYSCWFLKAPATACILLAFLTGCGSSNGSPDLVTYNANDTATVPAGIPTNTAWIGDSYVALGAWGAWFPGSINLGHGGDDTAAILARMPASLPATAYVWCGANDLNDGQARSVTLANYGAIIGAAHLAGAQRVICLSVLPYARQFPLVWNVGYNPSITDQLNQDLHAVALDHGAQWIDLTPAIADPQGWCAERYSMPAGIHLNYGGYLRILAVLRPAG